jgi:aminopeptidase YwaD
VRILAFSLIMAMVPLISIGQKIDRNLQKNLLNHLTILASDSMEGRRSGTHGEKRAASYIEDHFKKLDLVPYATNHGFSQLFSINDGDKLDPISHFVLNGHILDIDKHLFFLPFSSKQAQLEGEVYPTLKEKGGIWLVNIKEEYDKPIHPHTDIISDLKEFSNAAYKNGCKALLLYNAPDQFEGSFLKQAFVEDIGIPVVYIRPSSNNLLTDPEVKHTIKLSFKFYKSTRESRNVIGYIENKCDTSIIIGAHYDHLGYGEDGNSMFRNGPLQIHNGADDNASGTSMLIEFARYYSLNRKRTKQYNYIFAAFSGEELGLLGSKFMAETLVGYKKHIKFMINLDMVGRVNPSTNSLTIGGYGTSPDWPGVFSHNTNKDLIIKFDSSGTGPSDHTSFYRKNIPVLFYFSGLHQDYHKPSDDSDKINYVGMINIFQNVINVIGISRYYPINFTKTREVQTSTSARFSVSLGIMPDYSYNDGGVRIDGTSDGKIAQTIGLKSGDIIIRIGNHQINSVEAYMQVLSKFKKGDITEVEVKRGSDSIVKVFTF